MFSLNKLINLSPSVRKIIIACGIALSAMWFIGTSYIYFEQIRNYEFYSKTPGYQLLLDGKYFTTEFRETITQKNSSKSGRFITGGYQDHFEIQVFNLGGYLYLSLLPIFILWLLLVFLLWPEQLFNFCFLLVERFKGSQLQLKYPLLGVLVYLTIFSFTLGLYESLGLPVILVCTALAKTEVWTFIFLFWFSWNLFNIMRTEGFIKNCHCKDI